ncbi:MAG: hypothetical protein WBD27_06915 [Pyrinomonadaceae bacterium]
MTVQLNINQLKQFAPNSPILAFRPEDSGSPMQDWCSHLERNSNYRRELEEFAVVGDVVVRVADGTEPEPFERVKILSLEYAIKVLNDQTDAIEFIRCVRAIASPDATQFEYEQIAAYYYSEIRKREVSDVLKEMGLLGMQLEAVTNTVRDCEIDAVESAAVEQRLTVADQRRCREIAKNREPLPAPTPNFDDELASVIRRAGRSKVTRMIYDDFAEFLLDDADKTIEELDADFLTFEKLEQYDENGIIGFAMSSGQHSVVVYDFEVDVDASYLPADARSLGSELNLLFVGHRIGASAVQKARRFIVEHRAAQEEKRAERNGYSIPVETIPSAGQFADRPFSDEEFGDWLAAKLDTIYDRRVVRSFRRITHNRAGFPVEYLALLEINPDYEEMQYVANVCQILWNRQRSDFHVRNLRQKAYQDLYLDIRGTSDTAAVAGLKKQAYSDFKEQKTLSLKQFTALNTVAKSQEVRLATHITPATRKWLRVIATASVNRLRYLKFSLYNDNEIQALTRQEKQRLWDAVRSRETALQTSVDTGSHHAAVASQHGSQHSLSRQQSLPKQYVRVSPSSV